MNIKKLKVILVLLVIVIICFISILFLNALRQEEARNTLVENAIAGTNWPIEDVPLIVHEGLEVEDFGEYTCQANISSGVTYEEFREFLIDLYDAGFKPNKDYDSENPNRLVSSVEGTDITEITWIAEKEKYSVTVLWAKEGAVNEFNIPYEYNFDMNLFINSHAGSSGNNDSEKINNNENNISGSIEFNAGSGDINNIMSSGELN